VQGRSVVSPSEPAQAHSSLCIDAQQAFEGSSWNARDFNGPMIACWGIVTQKAFPPWVIILSAFIVLLSLFAFVLGLVGGYSADEYMTPAFSEQSVPPSRPY
jgi:hypothetical protein